MKQKKLASKKHSSKAAVKKGSYSRGDSTAQEILRVATLLFAQRGFDGVSTKEICDEAKANVSSLHYYFETKENLYFSVISSYEDQFRETITPILTIPNSVDELRVRLELFLENIFLFHQKHEHLSQIIQHELGLVTKRSEKLFNTFCPVIDKIKFFFQEAHRKKLIAKDVDPILLTYSFLKQTDGKSETNIGNPLLSYLGLDFYKKEDLQRYIKHSTSLFLDGILKRS